MIGCKIRLSCKWIYKVKENPLKNNNNKTRLVAKWFIQREGIVYGEVFCSVVRDTSINILLAFVTYFDLELGQMDVKTPYLHKVYHY